MHHIKTRGSGGSDHDDNLMPLCVLHHNHIHKSMNKFVDKHKIAPYLRSKGWEYFSVLGKWLAPKTAIKSYEKSLKH
jgi:hypothetical protein